MKLDVIYNEDCLFGMQRIPDGSVNMILCDLPYGATGLKWDTAIPLDLLWEQYRRIVNGYGAIVLTATQPFTTTLISSNLEYFKYCWVWHKSRAGDVFNAKNKPLRKHEDICVFSSGTTANGSHKRMPYVPQGLRSVQLTCRSAATRTAFFSPRPSHKRNYERAQTGYPTSILSFANDVGIHPTQKPVALFEYLIRTYTSAGEIVLDNCMGSGTTAIACINTGRRYIGFEKDPKYFAVSQKRISDHQPPLIHKEAA